MPRKRQSTRTSLVPGAGEHLLGLRAGQTVAGGEPEELTLQPFQLCPPRVTFAALPQCVEQEREFLRLAAGNGLPRPETQQVLSRAGNQVVRVDCRFLGTPVVVELLGHRFHRTKDQIGRDAEQLKALVLDGFGPYQFTYDQVVDRAGRRGLDRPCRPCHVQREGSGARCDRSLTLNTGSRVRRG